MRSLVGSQRRTVGQRIAGTPKLKTCGGISLFLDMTRAFDSVDRPTLFTHLSTQEIPESLLVLLSKWHENTHYKLQFQGATTTIKVGRGLRQGCKAAPLLWLEYMDLFLDRLITHTGHDWVAQCVTLYADDIHVGCSFESEGALRTAVTNMGHLLDILEDLCMTISCEKSFLLLTVAGTNPRLYMKPYIRRGSHGTTFEIPRSTGQTTSIPMKSSGRYLGAIMSYRMMEELTWKHRCKSAWLAFNRLKKWLQSRQLSVRYKMHLWQSCVHTILTYGILDMNSTVKTLHQYQQTVYTMIRMVIGDHSYRTHHTHQQAFQAHHIELPLPMLGRLAMNMLRRLNRREDTIASDDIVLTIPWTHLTETLRLIDAIHDTSAQVPIAVDQHQPVSTQAQQCPCCPFVTDSIPNLRRHLTVAHAKYQHRTTAIFPLDFALHGRPQCSHCHQVFTTWRSFSIHIERNCCQVTTAQPRHWWPTAMDRVDIEDREPTLDSPPADVDQFHGATQRFWTQLKQCIQTRSWTDIAALPDLSEYLQNHCMICGMWQNRFQELHGHLRLYHPTLIGGGVAKGTDHSPAARYITLYPLRPRLPTGPQLPCGLAT